jgi:hypothetical protein
MTKVYPRVKSKEYWLSLRILNDLYEESPDEASKVVIADAILQYRIKYEEV